MPLGKKNACQVRRLEDTDGDGIFDKSTVYADKMSWVVSVWLLRRRGLRPAPDKLYYFKDTSGDGVADERKEIIEGFSRYNVKGLANNMKWGLDNRITASGGTAQSSLHMEGKDVGPPRASDWALNPKMNELTRVTGGQQFGHSYDDWGNRFVCNNSNHIQHIVYPRQGVDRRTPDHRFADPVRRRRWGRRTGLLRTSPAELQRVVRTRRRAADPAFRSGCRRPSWSRPGSSRRRRASRSIAATPIRRVPRQRLHRRCRRQPDPSQDRGRERGELPRQAGG